MKPVHNEDMVQVSSSQPKWKASQRSDHVIPATVEEYNRAQRQLIYRQKIDKAMELDRLSKAANLASNSYNEVVTKVEKQVPKGYSNGALELDIGPDGDPKEEDVYGFKLLNILSTPLTFVDDEQLLLSYRFVDVRNSPNELAVFTPGTSMSEDEKLMQIAMIVCFDQRAKTAYIQSKCNSA